MKNTLSRFVLFSTKVNRQHLQLVLTIIALATLVLGVGAPFAGGGGTR